MFGDDYILKIAQATGEAAVAGLFEHVYRKLRLKTPEPMAENLAYAVVQRVLSNMFSLDLPVGFVQENVERIEREERRLKDDLRLCEVLSGAAYNVGYGYYVKFGGGRIVNRYIGFIRADNRAQRGTRSDWDLLRSMGEDLNRKEPRILEAYYVLRSKRLWIPRSDNPNEREYYEAVVQFMEASKAS